VPYIERDGSRVFFTDEGTGPPVILGHSLLCSGEMWASQLPALTEQYRVVNVDYRGHGQSDPAARGLTLYDLAEDMIAILDLVGIERAVWAGVSIGGMVALRAAIRHPERVGGMIVMDARSSAEARLKSAKYRSMVLGSKLLGMQRLVPSVLPIMFGKTTLETRPELIDEWRQRFEALEVNSFVGCLDALSHRESISSRLPTIDIPTLVVVGEEDAAQPPERSREIADGLPNSRLLVVRGAGHLSCVESPEVVTGAMLEFLAEHA